MKRLRFLITLFILWLFLIYNIERLSQPINISSVAYVFTALIAALTVFMPRLNEVPLWLIVGGPIPVFLTLKMWLGHRLWGMAIPLVVTEISFITLTSLLARQVNYALGEAEKVLTDVTIGLVGKPPATLATGQGEMYREVRRARTHQRPLSLIAVGVEEETLQNILPRILVETQLAMRKQLALAGIVKILDEELEDYHIIARQNNHFVVLLPETGEKDLSALEKHLHEVASTRLGIMLKTGACSLSDNVLTLERLVQEATAIMQHEQRPSALSESLLAHKQVPVVLASSNSTKKE